MQDVFSTCQSVLVTGCRSSAELHIVLGLAQCGFHVLVPRCHSSSLPVLQFLAQFRSQQCTTSAQALQRVSFVSLDVHDSEALGSLLQGVGAVVHSHLCVPSDGASQQDLWMGNVDATARLCQASLAAAVSRFVLISPATMLGRQQGSEPLGPSAAYLSDDSRSTYERSLFRREAQVRIAQQEGLPAVSVIVPAPVGPLCALPHHLGALSQAPMGFVGVADVARLVGLLLSQPLPQAQRLLCPGFMSSAQLLLCALGQHPASASRSVWLSLGRWLAECLGRHRKATLFSLPGVQYAVGAQADVFPFAPTPQDDVVADAIQFELFAENSGAKDFNNFGAFL